MPELPEVETVRRGLDQVLVGSKVKRAKVFDSPKSFPNPTDQVEQFLYGAKVTGVRRRAKVLLIDLDSGYTLVTHLKMTGQLVFRAAPEPNTENLAGPAVNSRIESQGVTRSGNAENLAGPAARSAPENFSVELKTFSGAAPPRVTTRLSRRLWPKASRTPRALCPVECTPRTACRFPANVILEVLPVDIRMIL
ncbi:hypothetical protein CR969_01220 [Candidatus Saccharibacteria bacterium]|nr:MAG: hypothetical protein CR969_01220 [Candidatus Saccharibacteria bacterium]